MDYKKRYHKIADAGMQERLRKAAATNGHEYEVGIASAIWRRDLPILDDIEARTEIPVTDVSFGKNRGRQSNQSESILLWQKGYHDKVLNQRRRPEAIVEKVGLGGVIEEVHIIEISLQTDLNKPGNTLDAAMSRAKGTQLAHTIALTSHHQRYENAKIFYYLVTPEEISSKTEIEFIVPMQNMIGTKNVTTFLYHVDHGVMPAAGNNPAPSQNQSGPGNLSGDTDRNEKEDNKSTKK